MFQLFFTEGIQIYLNNIFLRGDFTAVGTYNFESGQWENIQTKYEGTTTTSYIKVINYTHKISLTFAILHWKIKVNFNDFCITQFINQTFSNTFSLKILYFCVCFRQATTVLD